MSDTIDFSIFVDALGELERMYAQANSDVAMKDSALRRTIQTAVIKGFEYNYALSLKFIERFLEKRVPDLNQEDKPASFQELLRHALDYKLIHSIEIWADFRKMRNTTSHGYHASVADTIYKTAPAFIGEARYLLESMKAQEHGA